MRIIPGFYVPKGLSSRRYLLLSAGAGRRPSAEA
jgi:hypothetical protein